MGTLGNQPRRKGFDVMYRELDDALDMAKRIAQENSVPVESVIALWDVLERRRANDLAQEDGDFRDEHMAGIGEALDRIASAVSEGGAA